ncbi:uncharacterized protein THITE_2111291 [Thermothielavioides terrestris NRRL 8126]|uniref:C2H2-type domain-containing protein n=1 Tax=Thermothielavioides terrestris (strain ATCC 38088 / NRRL 8126) TaxID=578455 RepID=G2R1S7_THETT|nr:uncharacterized protein THITE_2111291 [Thermothielavioides terrestris NRRL 8126]AEO64904.1 hypothetical protein THITE_2111291 [Thermothielavioides terrestris NRRL 8126]
MPPRGSTLPPAQTASARSALQALYCQLCQKGYTRTHEYEAHLGSYDHAHKQRLKDMKAMVRDPGAAARARRQEMRAQEGGGVVSIKLGEAAAAAAAAPSGGANASASTGAGGGGFKKGGFKKTGFTASGFVSVAGGNGNGNGGEPAKVEKKADDSRTAGPAVGSELVESDTEDEGYEVYDPRKPTD